MKAIFIKLFIATSIVLLIATAFIFTELFLKTKNSTQIIWSKDDGSKVPNSFKFILFPNGGAFSYSDTAMMEDRSIWSSALINNYSELHNKVIKARNYDGHVRYISVDSMLLLDSVCNMMESIRQCIMRKSNSISPKIIDISTKITVTSTDCYVELILTSEGNSIDVFEYKVNNNTIIPTRWTRPVQRGLGSVP